MQRDVDSSAKVVSDLSVERESIKPDLQRSCSIAHSHRAKSPVDTFPKLDVKNNQKLTLAINKKINDLKGKEATSKKSRALPYLKAANGPTKIAARYTLKNRQQIPRRKVTNTIDREPTMRNDNGETAGGCRARINSRKAVVQTRRQKSIVNQNRPSIFVKRKMVEDGSFTKQAKKEVPVEKLPSLCDKSESSAASEIERSCEEVSL